MLDTCTEGLAPEPTRPGGQPLEEGSGTQEVDWDITGPVASTLTALVFCPAGLSV